MRHYIALIHKDADSAFGVSFPDLPGLVTAGSSLDEARAMASEALPFHVRGMVEDGEALPEPSSLEEIMADRENRDAVAILVDLADPQPKTVRVNITLPAPDLDRIDAYAERQGLTRSGFLLKAAREVMTNAPVTA
jgi:predicted RNase H-like HicB family nuclease